MSDNKDKVRDLAEILWQFHNDRLADPSINEMKPYIEPILALLKEEVRLGRIDEVERAIKVWKGELFDTGYTGSKLKERLARLNSTALDIKERKKDE